MRPEAPAIEALKVTRTYRGGGHEVRGIDQVSLAAARGEVVAVTGPSGSGKSTLLYLLGGLDVPDEGEVRVTGVDWAMRLDSVTAQEIVRLLVAAARERDAAVVMVTHDPTVAAHADRVLALHSGRLQAQVPADEVREAGQ